MIQVVGQILAEPSDSHPRNLLVCCLRVPLLHSLKADRLEATFLLRLREGIIVEDPAIQALPITAEGSRSELERRLLREPLPQVIPGFRGRVMRLIDEEV